MKMEERDRLIKEEGEVRVSLLIQLLIKNSRTEEIEKAVSDKDYQNKLFKEFHL